MDKRQDNLKVDLLLKGRVHQKNDNCTGRYLKLMNKMASIKLPGTLLFVALGLLFILLAFGLSETAVNLY